LKRQAFGANSESPAPTLQNTEGNRVAGRFGVSSSYMARVCTLFNVP